MWLLPGKPMGVASDPSLKSLRCCQGTFAQHWLLWGRFLGKRIRTVKATAWLQQAPECHMGGKSLILKVPIFSRARSTVCSGLLLKEKKKKQNWQNDLGGCDFPVCLSHPILAALSRVRLSNTLYCCISNAIHLRELKRNPIILTQPLTNTEHQVTGRE